MRKKKDYIRIKAHLTKFLSGTVFHNQSFQIVRVPSDDFIKKDALDFRNAHFQIVEPIQEFWNLFFRKERPVLRNHHIDF
jgi:hypothetical protein